MKKRIKSIYEYSIENNIPHIIKEYQGDVDIHNVGYRSRTPVKWICENGHEIIESPYNRLRRINAFCPICGKHRLGSLAQVYPEIAKSYSENNEVPADRIAGDSHYRVEWKCEHGHTYYRTISSQVSIKTCPVCTNNAPSDDYSLFALKPELKKEWLSKKNKGVDTTTIMPYSNRKYWWKCKHGHEYECSAADRFRGKGCPICSSRKLLVGFNDLATKRPELVKQWHPTKNGNLKPSDVFPNSEKRVWWKCEKGHEWEAKITNRSQGSGCPYCANKIRGKHTLPPNPPTITP